jgi:ABC-type transport system involved in multi-copper enzyme maturation permease subunit
MAILTIFEMTLHEAARRRILLASLVCGLAFLLLYGIGLHFILADIQKQGARGLMQRGLILNFFTLAGLYSVNFLTVMSAVLLPVDTLSGEIASGVLQTVASKPIARRDIVLGKWLAYVLVVGAYLLLLAGGVLLEVRLVSGFQLPGVAKGLPLMFLESIVLVTLSIAGGSRLSTVTSGVVAFGLYGLAFIGSWVEQVGGFTGNVAARDVGTVASLIMPSESLWQLAAHHMQPPLMSQLNLTPFSPVSVPSIAMVYWAMGYIVVLLLVALRSFDKRPL